MKRAADDNALEELGRAKAVLEGHGPGGDMRKLLKQPTPALLTLLLGQQCNLVTLQVQHQQGYCIQALSGIGHWNLMHDPCNL